jgi:hypothetical protein
MCIIDFSFALSGESNAAEAAKRGMNQRSIWRRFGTNLSWSSAPANDNKLEGE